MNKSRKNFNLSDRRIREVLKKQLCHQHKNSRHVKILEEFGIMHGSVRIDLVVISQTLHGYEIKSDTDTLRRLPLQQKNYCNVFDLITLVVGYQHIEKAIKLIPDWWGILVAEKGRNNMVILHSLRLAQNNPQVRPIAQLRLLWKKEAIALLNKYTSMSGLKYQTKETLYNIIARLLTPKKIHDEVVYSLFNRVNLIIGDKQIPYGD